jgi:hypothetical protein
LASRGERRVVDREPSGDFVLVGVAVTNDLRLPGHGRHHEGLAWRRLADRASGHSKLACGVAIDRLAGYRLLHPQDRPLRQMLGNPVAEQLNVECGVSLL